MNHLSSYIIRNYLSWLPDKTYLRLLFLIETGKILHLANPRTFQEKIQWLKLFNKHNEYTQMVDKVSAKKYVSNIIGEEYIIPTIGVWENFNDIQFKKLPNQFVLKTAHGGGSCSVIVCRDKKAFDYNHAKCILEKSLKSDIYRSYREWPYKNVPRRILVEELLITENNKDLTDYKFFCFSGEPLFCQVIRDRHSHETIDFYDMEWNHQEFVGLNPSVKNGMTPVPKPQNLEKMIHICRQLSKNTTFIRVDLYNLKGKIYFGELTFFPASGLGTFSPSTWNLKLGNMINLSDLKTKKR